MTPRQLFIDVSEIYRLARKGGEIRGISRVVQEITHELCMAGRATPIVAHEARGGLVSVDPALFADKRCYDRGYTNAAMGRPAKYRDIERFDPGTFDRSYLQVRNRFHAFYSRAIDRPGPAIGKKVDLDNAAILCVGAPPETRRVAEMARREGGHGPIIGLIHDVMPILGDDSLGSEFEKLYARSFILSDRLGVLWAANSKYSRDDTMRSVRDGILPSLSGDIPVVLLAHEMRAPSAPLANPPKFPKPYILTVGSLWGRKNGEALFEAMMRLGEQCPHLVAAGRNDPVVHDMIGPGGRFSALADRISWVDQPDHASLHALYQDACALVFPSRYEGFGLPVGEALWLGTPAIASNATSIPEVGGDLALYFAPDDPETLASHIARLTTDQAYDSALRARIAAAKPTLRSWKQVALDFEALALR